MRALCWFSLVFVLVAGCVCEPLDNSQDAGLPQTDAGELEQQFDAGTFILDAGQFNEDPADGGMLDGGEEMPDASVSFDSDGGALDPGAVDAGDTDAGSAQDPDAGAIDAGIQDFEPFIVAGMDHTLVSRRGGKVEGWGFGGFGEIGITLLLPFNRARAVHGSMCHFVAR